MASRRPERGPVRGIDLERQVRRVLRTARSTAPIARAGLDRIAGGFSNHAWRATSRDGERWFVRLGTPKALRLGADLTGERAMLELAARTGLAPSVVRCDPGRGLLVTRWVDTESGRRRHASAPRSRHVQVAATLARLHALAPPRAVRRVDFARQARTLAPLARTSAAHATLQSVASTVFAELAATQRAWVPCHHDLNPLNLLYDRSSRLWLVDWEYAGLGDAAFDLASYASQHGLDARAQATFLRRYLAAGGHPDGERLELARWAFDYVQWLWYRAARAEAASVPDALAGKDRSAVAIRAKRLQRSLQARARRVLRCNNDRFEDSDSKRVRHGEDGGDRS